MSDKPQEVKEEKSRDIEDIINEISKYIGIDINISVEEQLEKIFETIILYKNLEEFKSGEMNGAQGEISIEVKEKLLDLKEKMMERKGEISQETINKIKEQVDNILSEIGERERSIKAKERDLNEKEKNITEMKRSLEQEKKKLMELAQMQREEYLKVLEEETKTKEDELKGKLRLLELKEKEIKEREKNILKQEIELLEEQIKSEIQERKIRTGIRKLDDLLNGGVPVPSNIMVYGPPFAGKEEMLYNIMTSSIQRGLPSIIVTFDRTTESLLQGMSYFSPVVRGYLDLEMLYVIDTFTKTTKDVQTESSSIIYLENQTDLEGVTRELNRISNELMKKSGSVIVALFGFSTILNFLDKSQTLKFLQTFATERRDQNNVSFYMVEKGLHAENEIQAIAHFMDGILEFKTEGNKSFINVKGVTNVMSRDWIEVDFNKNSFNLKSFTLSKIR